MGPGNFIAPHQVNRQRPVSPGREFVTQPTGSASQYSTQPRVQPPNYIDDVDIGRNWFSPMQPVWPFGPPYVTWPRAWDYPTGYNLIFDSGRQQLFAFLRTLADSGEGVLRTVIESRKDQLLHMPWQFQLKGDPKRKDKRLDFLNEFFAFPDHVRDFDTWTRMLLDDMLVCDAATIYLWKRKNGTPYRLEVMDGAMFKVLVDDAGRIPDPPQPAYQQVVEGLPMDNFTRQELIYAPRNPRTYLPVYGLCHSDDTEILTREGWRRFSELPRGVEVATRNPVTKHFEWQLPLGYIETEYEGDICEFGERFVTFRVTPQHEMIVAQNDRRRGRYGVERKIRAGDLEGYAHQYFQVPMTCSGWTGVDISTHHFGNMRQVAAGVEEMRRLRTDGLSYSAIAALVNRPASSVAWSLTAGKYEGGGSVGLDVEMDGDDFAAFMGCWLAEGSLSKGRVVVISQSPCSKGFEPYKSLLQRIFGERVTHDGRNFCINSTALARYLTQFGHAATKFVPEEIMNAPPAQIALFLQYYVLGDGTTVRGQTYIYSVSRRMVDQLQELAQKIGMHATIRPCKLRDSVMSDGRVIKAARLQPQWRVALCKRKYRGFRIRRTPYRGKVYCVTVPNGSIYTRRNGVAGWASNSPTEQCYLRITEMVRQEQYALGQWQDGTLPDMILSAPPEWTPEQLSEFQAYFDVLLSGVTRLKSMARFVPGGVKPLLAKGTTAEILASLEKREERLARIICFAFSISPANFVSMMNRATATNLADEAAQEGLYPLMKWRANLMNRILWQWFGWLDIEFVHLPTPNTDPLKRAQVFHIYVSDGVMTRNEVRDQLDLPPQAGGDVLTVAQGNQTLPLSMLGQPASRPGIGAPAGQVRPGIGTPAGQAELPAPGRGNERRLPLGTTEAEADKVLLPSEKKSLPSRQRGSNETWNSY